MSFIRGGVTFLVMKLHSFLFFMILLGIQSAIAAEVSLEEENKARNSGLSSIQTYKSATTSQKTYQSKNDGKNANTQELKYGAIPAFEVFEDKDLDGRYGESETRLQDKDNDGRKGESEAKLGTENVALNQKVTVLNNMNFGTSTFDAGGAQPRSSLYKEEKKSASSEKSEDEEDEAPSRPKARVLVA